MEILNYIFYGCIAGIIYLFFAFFRGASNYNIIVTIILDILCGAICTLVFGFSMLQISSGNFSVYELIGFLLGMIIVKFSIGNLVASMAFFVYNKIVIKLYNKFKLVVRGRKNGGKKVNTTCKTNN